MLNPTYPQTPLRTDIATLLQQSNGRGQDELTKLKEVIRNGYLEIQALSAQNILESGVVSDKIRTYFPNLITTASNIHLRDHPLFDQLGTLVDQRNMHWKYNHAAAEPRFLDSHVDLSLPNEVAYDFHPPL